ncbi:endonuclease G [Paraburkholderia steynii]|uniref:Endonuclease G n=1 Tax=Paraburkholderia steynii TaxID=1245441 RepID=A0A7Z7BA32_9BURK|nr:DNA/RNA non-specific endonuclease [Paraburkholderia steynii]SDI38440.1 endonuclease G [Paraburkholderia steynii]
MTNEERLDALKKRLTPEMETAVRAAFDAGRLPRSLMSAMSRSSVDALKAGQALESVAVAGTAALEGLEAIVLLVGRPPLLVRNDTVVLEPMPELPQETSALIRGVEKWVPSVGRIEFRNNDMAWGGTGWVAEQRKKGALVVTNRHVAQIVARRKADGSAVFMRAPSGARYGAAIDFGEEVESKADDNSRTAELTRIEYLADDASADVALLWIEAADFKLPSPFQLVGDKAKVAKADLVALIGYPAYDSRNDADAQARYFRDLYEVKRLAPGKILQPPGNGVLTYDCTSLGGNSGSPLIRLEDGKVIGLHFSGVYGKANTAVSAQTLSALLKGGRPVSVPLQAGREEAKDGSHAATYFQDREGFGTRFLTKKTGGRAVPTPWPGLPADLAADLAEPSDQPSEPNELRYTHFGVKYSAKLKLPLITAVNIDGDAAVRIKRGNDKWFTDERIPKSIQLGSKNFQDAEIDRGHMVRREDPNWGEEAEAQLANDDTFHYVNAAAQHARLNQGKALWQGLENYILDNARTHGFRACVFTGPILRDPDGEEEEIEIDGAIAPLEFWKLVVTLDVKDKALHATAYVLSQGQLIRKLLEARSRTEALEGFVLGAYRTFQVAIADLAAATGYDFKAYIKADPLFKTTEGQVALKSGEPVFVPIDEETDIIL